MSIIRFTFFLTLLLMSAAAMCQVSDIGRIIQWKEIPAGIQGKTERAYFRVSVYNENTIRIRVSLSQAMDDFSYLLAPSIPVSTTSFSIIDKGSSLLIQTPVIDMELEKVPAFRAIFRNKMGDVINEDMPGKGFGTGFIGNRSNLYKKLQPGERFVGLGEVLGNLDKRGGAFTLNNTDTYKYGDPRLPMYTNVPFYIGIHGGHLYGLFYHNTYKSFFNFGISTPEFSSITADGGDVDYFIIYDTSIGGILSNYTSLTGRMPLPPMWGLGYHQSRCSYYPQENVEILAETFRRKQIPIDCIVLDADYLQDYEPFRINTTRFPDMKGLAKRLANLGIEVTASVNPGIKVDSTYFAHWDGISKDVFVKYADGSLFTAEIAPSLNNFVDFTKPTARKWWADHMKYLPDNGIHGYWNDMNEPAVGGSYLPDNLVFDFDGRKANALEAKNVYGMQMARSSYESAIKYGEGRRPFVLTRSGFAGVQRYAAVWTGDNTASEEYLLGGTLLNCQMGLSGIPFVGDDIGGYIGPTSKELFTRWMQIGMFSPFARNHKEAFSLANEPWSFGEEAEAISREFIGFRYRLMPYLYSAIYEASSAGMPVARSLCIDYPFNSKVYDLIYQFQYLFGNAILVVPVIPSEKAKQVFLPPGEWYNLYTDEKLQGEAEFSQPCPIFEIPLFVKESSIIPMQSLVQSTKFSPSDTMFLHIYYGSNSSSFVYYEDDGYSLKYQERDYCKRTIIHDPSNRKLDFSIKEGNFSSRFRQIKCIFHGFDRISEVMVNGKSIPLKEESQPLINPIIGLKDIYDPGYYKNIESKRTIRQQQTIVIENTAAPIRIQWE